MNKLEDDLLKNDASNLRKDEENTSCEVNVKFFEALSDFVTKVSNICNTFNEEFAPKIDSFFDALEDNIHDWINEFETKQFYLSENLGCQGWAYLFFLFDDKYTDLDKTYTHIHHCKSLKKDSEIDAYMYDVLGSDICLNKMYEIIKASLSPTDIKKLDLAYHHYNNDNYFDCSGLLFELIDSQNIKISIKAIKDGKSIEKTGQGYKAFLNVWNCYIAPRFWLNKIKPNMPNERKHEIDTARENTHICVRNMKMIYSAFSLAYCLNYIYRNLDWKEDSLKDVSLIRHWKMHGMYSLDDISKIDCLKLISILTQLITTYKEAGIYK